MIMTAVWIILGLVALLVFLFLFAWFKAIGASIARNRRLDELIRPAVDAINGKEAVAGAMIMKLAEFPATRNHLFTKLKEMGKAELFPENFRSVEKAAESDLARWLMHRNELGAAPAEMELVKKIDVAEKEKKGSVFLFKFRADASHWAAENGWMAGVAGPYWEGEEPDFAAGTFSELVPFEEMTIEQHVDHLREALSKKGLVVPS